MIIKSKRIFLVFIGLISIVWATPSLAVSPVNVKVSEDKLQASIPVSSTINIDVVVEFEKSIGLTADNIVIEAFLIPVNDTSVLSRIKSSAVNLHPDFPVLLRISPKEGKGFSFEGLASVEIYTKAIDYQTGMPAKLFTSHAGGNFEDITSMVSAGSLRARGNLGKFSDFIIVLDERPLKIDTESKLAQIDQILLDNQTDVNSLLFNELRGVSNMLETAVSLENFEQALLLTDNLILLIENLNGGEIDNVWRSSNDLVNVKADLLSVLKSLRYRLRL
nr:DUF6689 family protein [uncultured Glaciecola sp.]